MTQHSDSENDDASDQNASQPLLLQSSSSMPNSKNCSTTTIKLPAAANHTENDSNIAIENRILIKLGHLANIKLKRHDYRRSHRDKCTRINIGLFAISFLTVIYFCVSMNLSVEKPSPQLIVDIPPVDANLTGDKGKFHTANELDLRKTNILHVELLNGQGKKCHVKRTRQSHWNYIEWNIRFIDYFYGKSWDIFNISFRFEIFGVIVGI